MFVFCYATSVKFHQHSINFFVQFWLVMKTILWYIIYDVKRLVCYIRIKYVAHQRFDHANWLALCIYTKKKWKGSCVLTASKTVGSFWNTSNIFIHISVQLSLKGRDKPMRGSRCTVRRCPSQHCVVSSMDFMNSIDICGTHQAYKYIQSMPRRKICFVLFLLIRRCTNDYLFKQFLIVNMPIT